MNAYVVSSVQCSTTRSPTFQYLHFQFLYDHVTTPMAVLCQSTPLFFSLSIPHRCFRHTYISHPVILHNLNIPLCSLFVGTPCISFPGFERLDPHTLSSSSYCLSLSWLHHSFLLLSIHLFWCHITPTYHCMSSIVDPLCREELLLTLSARIALQLYKTGSLSALGNIDVCLWFIGAQTHSQPLELQIRSSPCTASHS